MFRLDIAIDEWCQEIHRKSPFREAHVDELKDHLYCEIERLMGEGQGPERAFVHATQSLGSPAILAQEHHKNTTLLCRFFAPLVRADEFVVEYLRAHFTPKQATTLLLGISLFAAASMIVCRLLFSDSHFGVSSSYWIIALWFVPFSWLSKISNGPKDKKQASTD